MIMAKEIDEIEDGDSSSDALGHTDLDEKTEDTASDDEKDVGNKPDDTKEDFRFEDGDDDWDKAPEGADLSDSGEEKGEVKEVEEVEKEEVKEVEVEKKELSEEEKQDEKIKEDVIKYLSEKEGGTKYVVKGKEYDMQDLSPQEFRDRFSKAGRFYERMEEISAKEKIINERERLAEDGARRSQEIMQKYGGGEPKDTSSELPEFFKPDADDDYETKAMKKAYNSLQSKVDKLERGQEERDFSVQKQDLFRQLDSLEQEFPMLSKSEVIAVKSMPEYAGVDMRLIAENSHNARVSDEYLDSFFKARPEKLRELNEKAIEGHLMKNPKVRKVSRKKSSTTASGKVSSDKKKTPRTLDSIEDYVDGKGGWDNVMPDLDED